MIAKISATLIIPAKSAINIAAEMIKPIVVANLLGAALVGLPAIFNRRSMPVLI
jgi:hypothetical protein